MRTRDAWPRPTKLSWAVSSIDPRVKKSARQVESVLSSRGLDLEGRRWAAYLIYLKLLKGMCTKRRLILANSLGYVVDYRERKRLGL